jgi:hypothetical protein
MSFQAYLDAIEAKTGRTPRQLLEVARERGYDEMTKAAVIVGWLAADFGLGRGHSMALVHVNKNGPVITDGAQSSSVTTAQAYSLSRSRARSNAPWPCIRGSAWR